MWIALLASCRYEKRFKINEIREFRSYSTFYCFILVLWHLRAERDMSFCVSSLLFFSFLLSLTQLDSPACMFNILSYVHIFCLKSNPDAPRHGRRELNVVEQATKSNENERISSDVGQKNLRLEKSSQSFSYILVYTSNSYGKMFSLAWAEYIQSLPSMRAIQTISLHKKSKEKK